MTRECKGLFTFLATPTRHDGSIDLARLNEIADDQIAAGVDGVTLFGSTGGIGLFAEEERKEAAASLVEHVAGRVPVMVGTGAMTTAEAIRLSHHAQQVGADIVLVVPITYWLLNEDEIIGHYSAIASEVTLPVMLYNNPRLTGVDIVPAVVARLAQIPNIVAIKEAAPDLLRVAVLRRTVRGSMRVFAGRDVIAFEAMMLGARDWASGITNIVPEYCVKLYRLISLDKRDEACALWRAMLPLVSFAMEKGLVRACHTSFEIGGRPIGAPRSPLRPLSAEDARTLGILISELKRQPVEHTSTRQVAATV